jgi:hypothetical protein
MGTSVTAKALAVGTVHVYCEYGTYRDVYIITIKSPTASATNFSLTPITGTTVQGSGQFVLSFASQVVTSGTVSWRVNSSEFAFENQTSIITNGQYATNTATFTPIGRTVTTTETYTITATFIPNDNGPSIDKTITVTIVPAPANPS